jgi:hypothetical protein
VKIIYLEFFLRQWAGFWILEEKRSLRVTNIIYTCNEGMGDVYVQTMYLNMELLTFEKS